MSLELETQVETMFRNLEEKTGISYEGWMKLVKDSGLTAHKEIMKLLKEEHGLTHGYANTISILARRQMEAEASGIHPAEIDLVAEQYQGDKYALRLIYDKLIAAVEGFGSDVEIAPKKTYVSLRRNKQFGLVQPSTKTRVDVGLNLPTTASGERLEASGSFNSMVSHRVRLEKPEQVDEELIGWLRAAYESA
jgi:hypothetical protein